MTHGEIVKNTFKITIALVIIQLIRLVASLFVLEGSSDTYDMLVKIIIILALLFSIILMARRENISLSLFFMSSNTKFVMVYSLVCVVLLFAIITMPAFTCGYTLERLLPYVYAILIIPLFEELLFRGFLWERAREMFGDNKKVFLFILCLYVFWTVTSVGILNYYTGILINYSIPLVFIKRLGLGLVLGLILGFTRIFSKNTFTCILLHALINVLIVLFI